jgi:hypothetical protein
VSDALDTLLVSLHGVCDALDAVEICLGEDAPKPDPLPVERRATAAVEHAAAAREARLCVDRARRAGESELRWSLVLQAHTRLCDAHTGFTAALGGYPALTELAGYCDEHGPAWTRWFTSVARGASACPPRFDAAHRAFGDAFGRLVERMVVVPWHPDHTQDPAQGGLP